MYKNVIRPRLYHFATVAHQEEFKQLQEDNKKQAKRIKELEADLKETMETFEDNNKSAYNEGYAQGRSYQAIIENRARDRFLDKLKKILCSKCKKQVQEG